MVRDSLEEVFYLAELSGWVQVVVELQLQGEMALVALLVLEGLEALEKLAQ